jgi:hypothetical protein
MGLWTATKALFSGRPGDAADYLFVDEETIKASNEADRKLDELNRKKREEGSLTEIQYRERLARLTNNAFPDFVTDTGERGKLFEQPGTNPSLGFNEGLKEGATNIRKALSKAFNKGAGLTLQLVPWQVWAVAAGYLLFITAPYWLPGFRKLAAKK